MSRPDHPANTGEKAARPVRPSRSLGAGELANVAGPSPLLDAEQAGALLNVPSTWVLAEARADRIPHVRLGRYVRFDELELEAWWVGRRRGPWRTRGAAAGAARAGSRPVPRSGDRA